MSVPLTINGVTFQYPQQFDKNWGPTLTNWSTAVTNALKPLTGGFLTLSPFPSTGISFANATNTGFLNLTINGSNQLTFNGTPIGATTALTNSHILVGNVSNLPADVAMTGDITISNTGVTTIGAGKVLNSNIAAAAGITLTKLAALTASQIVTTDGSGFLTTTSSPSLTELGYLTGVTSSIQTQFTGVQSQFTTVNSTFLPLTGGTMSGAISMASHKITAITAGSTNGDAISYGQSGAVLSGLDVSSQKITNIANGTTATDAATFGQIKYFQTIQGTTTSQTNVTSSTFTATALTATITPSSASHRIKITLSTSVANTRPDLTFAYATIFRNVTNLGGVNGFNTIIVGSTLSNSVFVPFNMVYIDSPATTSATAYTLYIRSTDNVSTLRTCSNSQIDVIVLEEIV